MALLFEVYREADIKKETQRFIDPMKKGLVPWICKKIYLLLVAGGWLVHNALRGYYLWSDGLCVLCTAQARLK